MRIIWMLIVIFGLASCTTVSQTTSQTPTTSVAPPAWKPRETSLNKINSWQIQGKIAVQTQRDSGSATVNWTKRGQNYQVALMGPLGTHSMKLDGKPGKVVLTSSDGKTATASSPEQLLANQWGFNIPVSYLNYWIRGLPAPGAAEKQFDAQGRLKDLSQQGWHVQFIDYVQKKGVELPNKIFLSSNAIKVKIIVYDWISF